MKLATAVQMRELDRLATEEDRIPSIDLMEQAADGLSRLLWNCCRGGPESAGRQCCAAREITAETVFRLQESCSSRGSM